ncbi:MAG: type IV secretion system DNA-binding domain-containing protein [Bryobacteraceae bacterium]|nr:type IV secretion system DNA-binding domain-containing protein [Bryobacteraceae bacterium]
MSESVLPETLEERLIRQFYDWERWGRGWTVWPEPVDLEPPFHPFFGHYLPREAGPPLDDARKPTFLSNLSDRFVGLFRSPESPPETTASEQEERLPYVFQDETDLTTFQVTLPPETKVTSDASEQFLLSLGQLRRPVSFEVVGTGESVVVLLVCSKPDRFHLRGQMEAYFPDALISERTGYLESLWGASGNKSGAVVDFGLSNEFMRPLRFFDRFDPDPLSGIIGSMTDLGKDETAVFQVLFSPTVNRWAESIMRSVTDGDGGHFFVDDRAMVSLAGTKISSPLFAAVVRVGAESPKLRRAWRIVEALSRGLRQFADPQGNELLPLKNSGYDNLQHSEDLLLRRSRRCGMLLNCEELVSLVHLPSASVRSAKLKREDRKTKAAPTLAFGYKLALGENIHAGKSAKVTLGPESRVRHTYVIGASGTGKSTLLLNMIVQDIENGEGLAVLDPHGDLIDQVLGYIPESRHADVLLFDPSDEEYPVGFNILHAHSDLERNLLSSDLVAIFRRLSTSWGDQMNSVFANAIIAFLDSSEGGTLAELRRFLVDADFRRSFLPTLNDPEIVYYWQKEFSLLSGRPQAPLLTRLDTFLRPKIIRHMVCQKENRLDLAAMMNGGKIVLAKLTQGAIGEENSYLLGSLLVSKIHQMAMSRQQMEAASRRNFYLYIDEFHNFATPSMSAILSGARKYRLGLVLAHQELRQLAAKDPDVASAVIANPYTRICFRLGDADARKLAEGFSFFDAKDLQNLGIGEAICRIERGDYDFNLKTTPLPAVDSATAATRRERIVTLSRERYATARETVEAQLLSARPAILKKEPKASPEPPQPQKPPAERAAPVVPVVPLEPLAEPAPIPKPKPQKRTASELGGHGGPQHKYLQELIKRWAEDKGYRATIEKAILDGLGSVDVALESDERSIACEIGMTTSLEHEIGNLQKCLAAGFDYAVMVSTNKRMISKAASFLEQLGEQDSARVRLFAPEELFSFIAQLEASAEPKEEVVKGYKVKVRFKALGDAEEKARKQAIAQTVAQAMRRMKPKM